MGQVMAFPNITLYGLALSLAAVWRFSCLPIKIQPNKAYDSIIQTYCHACS